MKIFREALVDGGCVQLIMDSEGWYILRAIWDANGTETWGRHGLNREQNNQSKMDNYESMVERWTDDNCAHIDDFDGYNAWQEAVAQEARQS